jgi:hypothetical protein
MAAHEVMHCQWLIVNFEIGVKIIQQYLVHIFLDLFLFLSLSKIETNLKKSTAIG